MTCDILSLINSTLLTTNMIPLSTKMPVPDDMHSFFHKRMYNHMLVQCHPCPVLYLVSPLNLTYFAISLGPFSRCWDCSVKVIHFIRVHGPYYINPYYVRIIYPKLLTHFILLRYKYFPEHFVFIHNL
jgi:hypothetical protein